MQIIIKVLKGKDCKLDVTPSTTILEVKQLIEQNLQIPVANQKLLLLGRTLSDEKQIEEYSNIKDGSKLNLILKRPEGLRETVHRNFRKYYNEQQAESMTKAFMKDFEKSIRTCSLDDLERIANNMQRG